ncbi:MAG: lytic murein transglycosylase, partial [Solirubrobacteraceae bacterium]
VEGQGNVAPAPEQVAGPGALSALLANAAVSDKALQFFQVPLFLLPIYQAAAIQYGVPWEILAAINEVETDYGTDLAVSTAGAVGWMQFMPQTWLQYGVDALDAGYADPYNPVDAVFAAARYLRAAGAANNLRGSVFAYNHSQTYVESVMLRARLLASYPQSVLATLTGLTEGSLPVSGAQVKPNPAAYSPSDPQSPSSAPAPSASVQNALGDTQNFIELLASSNAPVVAVEDGRVIAMGHSKALGRYLTLRDVYGDVFTYADLGSIAPSFRVSKSSKLEVPQSVRVGAQTAGEATPKLSASAGHQPSTIAASTPNTQPTQAPSAPVGKVRLFAHPENPDAIAAMARSSSDTLHSGRLPLRVGSVLPQGTIIGYLASGPAASLRFTIRPQGDTATIDPQPILENWGQLNTALHPQGAKDKNGLIGATADDVFLLTHGELQRAVLSDPGITLSACDRTEIASGASHNGVLAALLFLSRSGLKPTVSALHCNQSKYTSNGSISPFYDGQAVDISQINGIPVAHHQGVGSITDLTIRTLLTLQGQFAPDQIISLMRYPGAHSTIARSDHGAYIELRFPLASAAVDPTTMELAHAAAKGKSAPAPAQVSSSLSSQQWNRLVTRIGSLPAPKIPTKPSKWAIRDRH